MNLHLLHHWLVSMRGGEKVLEKFCELFPAVPLHTLVYKKESPLSNAILQRPIETTSLDRIPGVPGFYKSMLPLFPQAISRHKVNADFIISSDASMIKGMQNVNEVPHVCYCHSPPRYLWDLQEEYLKRLSPVKKTIFKKLTPYLRDFDRNAAEKVDHFIANSTFVKNRIKRVYNREATIIHPPVELSAFRWDQPSENFYLIVSALVPYKKVDLAVRAFNQIKKPLIVIGDGSERAQLETLAGDNVLIKGSQTFDSVISYFERCKAFVFPGVEDFGITPLEAQAAGKPVIAFRKGGALDTIREGETGLFFSEQTPEALIETIEYYEKNTPQFSPDICREQAEKFGPERFTEEVKHFLKSTYPSYFSGYEWGEN